MIKKCSMLFSMLSRLKNLPFLVLVPLVGYCSSQTFISGDAFRSYSDFVFDEIDDSLDPTEVTPGSTVFVQTSLLSRFFEMVHPEIPYKYILITHNGSAAVPGNFSGYLDDPKIIAWFGENWDGTAHYKIHPIPKGTSNVSVKKEKIRILQEELKEKKYLSHMSFNLRNNFQLRWSIFRRFCTAPYVYRTVAKPFDQTICDVAVAQFEIAPQGGGLDTHRVWNSLYLDVIPIVASSSLDPLYADLPVLVVNTWGEVNQNFLTQKYEEMRGQRFHLEKIYMEYWMQLIDSYKTRL